MFNKISTLLKIPLVCLIWELFSMFSPEQSHVPHFWNVFASIESFARFSDHTESHLLAGTQVLIVESLRSILRASLGMFFGAICGYVLGAAVLMIPGWQLVPVKIIASLRAVPPLALIFLLVFLSPNGEFAAVVYVAICVTLLVSGTLHNTRQYLPESLLRQVRHLGGGRWHQIRDVAAPAMWFQTRQTCAWASQLLLPFTFGAELINSRSGGLGALGYQAFIYANLTQLMTLAVVYIFLGHFLTSLATKFIATHQIKSHTEHENEK
jgi:ABC-type nitrate/sulfonate/bicarbonate transport system permease component